MCLLFHQKPPKTRIVQNDGHKIQTKRAQNYNKKGHQQSRWPFYTLVIRY
jgi:hypothetical protein